MAKRTWLEWMRYDKYFQDELPCDVLVDDSIPEMITFFAVCECGRLIARATAGSYGKAWGSLVRQTTSGTCRICTSDRAARTAPIRSRASVTITTGTTIRRISSIRGIGG